MVGVAVAIGALNVATGVDVAIAVDVAEAMLVVVGAGVGVVHRIATTRRLIFIDSDTDCVPTRWR